jgi:hypothetical protein
MKNYFYYNVLRNTVVNFLDAFNDIQIARYDPTTGNLIKYVKVPLKLWAKEKSWYWINESNVTDGGTYDERLPMMSAEILSITYDATRQTNPFSKITLNTTATSAASAAASTGTLLKLLNTVPYNIAFSIRIWALYMVDIDQILEQILPYFSPTIQLKIGVSQLDVAFDAKVVFESATPEIDSEYGDEDRRVIKWNLDFNLQTYLFKPVEVSKITKSIFINEYTSDKQWAARQTDSTFTSGGSAGEAKSLIGYHPFYDTNGAKLYNYELFTV